MSFAARGRNGTAPRLARVSIVAAMAVGSIAMWLVNPFVWIWIVSRLQQSNDQPGLGPYGLMLIGITATAIATAKGLASLNRLYGRVTGTTPTVRVVVPWRRSLRDGRHGGGDSDAGRPVTVLDVVMVISVLLGLIAFATWYVIVNPTPPGPGPGGSKD